MQPVSESSRVKYSPLIIFVVVYGLVAGIGYFTSDNASAAAVEPPANHIMVEQSQSFIVKARSVEAAAAAVRAVGAEVTHELRIISSVAARLTPAQLKKLEDNIEVLKITRDGGMETSAG